MLAMVEEAASDAPEEPTIPSLDPSVAKASVSENGSQSISAAAQPLTVGPGLYLFRVRSGAPTTSAGRTDIPLPAVNLTVVPDGSPGNVEFMSAPNGSGTWLRNPSDMVVARVADGVATLLLTSLRNPGGPLLSIEVERLGKQEIPAEPDAAITEASVAGLSTPIDEPLSSPGLRAELCLHIQRRGDRVFTTPAWAGFRGERIWIESFSINPLEIISVDQIEYKGLTATGYETPWLSKGTLCGTRGKSMPLLGFAVRLKPQSGGQLFDCEYTGAFLSGAVVGPCRNGAPCVSAQSDDPLEAMQLRIIERFEEVCPLPGQPSVEPTSHLRRRSGRSGKSVRSTPPSTVQMDAPAVART
jgi:hypothetical protein